MRSVWGRHHLILHPQTPSRSVEWVTAQVEKCDGHLFIEYHVKHAGTLLVPGFRKPMRTDFLWHSTCFEAFFADADAGNYREFNFAPSTEWAAYSFEGYREGMQDLLLQHDPEIAITPDANGHFWLEVDGIDHGDSKGDLRVALSAVIEETDGTKSYWALAHPPGKPDFHHPTCFAVTLAATEAS